MKDGPEFKIIELYEHDGEQFVCFKPPVSMDDIESLPAPSWEQDTADRGVGTIRNNRDQVGYLRWASTPACEDGLSKYAEQIGEQLGRYVVHAPN